MSKVFKIKQNRIYLGEKYLENKEYIQDMKIFDATNPVHVKCLSYYYINMIQAELDRTARRWNLQIYGHPVDLDDLTVCNDLYSSF